MSVVYNYTMYQGDALPISVVYKDSAGDPIDLTGYGARVAVVWGDTDSDEWTANESTGITLGGAAGTIEVVVPASVSASFPVSKKNVKYQLSVDPDGGDDDRVTILSGTIEVLYSAIEDADD